MSLGFFKLIKNCTSQFHSSKQLLFPHVFTSFLRTSRIWKYEVNIYLRLLDCSDLLSPEALDFFQRNHSVFTFLAFPLFSGTG
jgi:hypothetical protein